MKNWFRRTLAPLVLLLVCPHFVILLWYTHTQLHGSVELLAQKINERGMWTTLVSVWRPVIFGSPTAWAILAAFAAFELALMRLLPGKQVAGAVTPAGKIPVYPDNGLLAFAVTVAAFLLDSYGLGWFSPTILYDHFGELLGALNLFSLGFCLLLYLHGRAAPPSLDRGTSGNFLYDYYRGIELHPRILGWDVKQFTNCRFGMMAWPLLLLSYAAKQRELYGFVADSMWVAVGIQLVYITKFFSWEAGYLRTLDIAHDRAGFYLCWGCLVWVPSLYTASTLYLVQHPNHLGALATASLFLTGVAAVGVNYWADHQKQRVRSTGGKTKVWGREPQLIVASYRTESGEDKQNLLLVSGFWGVSRHFHYLPELLAALCWTLPALFTHTLPYAYFVFLTILLTHRTWRDDERCAGKYGEAWELYRSRVPYRMIPGVF